MALMIAPCIRLVTPPRIEKMVCEKMYDPAQNSGAECQMCISSVHGQVGMAGTPVIPAPNAPATTLLVPAKSKRCFGPAIRRLSQAPISVRQQRTNGQELSVEVQWLRGVLLDGCHVER